LLGDACLLSIVECPDETAAQKSSLAIASRGAFVLQTQTELALDSFVSLEDEAREIAGK